MRKLKAGLLLFLAFFIGKELSAFTPQPVVSNPRAILSYPIENWRDSRYEFFRWDEFPEVIIFDTANYAVQNRLVKRLAFFVEKAGFAGRLMHDWEIADLHGWNAHDYRAEDLARFFETARRSNFPLLREELELEDILINAGILRRNSRSEIIAGRGAIISLSRESDRVNTSLRPRFMAHEAYHAIFFIDEDFRNFSRQRWNNFPDTAKNALLAYFEIQGYDLDNEYLMVKEFKGHILQQSVAGASWFYGDFLPNRVLSGSPGFRAQLPAREEVRDGRRFWPDLANTFTAEAEVFSRYVNDRWGFAAGRPWRQ
ncbi:MAG: hypothetical protein FWH19_05450 [Treponema sp.]|nr:hypothetical protein [Treponema sp.]